MNGPFFVTGQRVIDLIELGFNDTSTLVGHFMSSSREREKRARRYQRWKRGTGEKGKWMKVKKRRNEKIPPSTFTCCKDSRTCPTVSQYQLHDTFASPNHPTGQRVYFVFGTPITKFRLDLEVFFCVFFFFFFFFFSFVNSAKVLITHRANKMIVYGRRIIISKNMDCHRRTFGLKGK